MTTSWKRDPQVQQLYAFNSSDSSRRTADDFVLAGRPEAGIWSNGTKLWAMDTDGTLRVFDLSGTDPNVAYGEEFTDLRADLSPDGYRQRDSREVDAPRGIWSDGSTLWVVDPDNDKVFAFGLPGTSSCTSGGNFCRQSTKDFDLHSDNGNAWGITATDDTWWVSDVIDDKIYAYTRTDDSTNGTRIDSKDIDYRTAVNTFNQVLLYGLSSTGTTLYAAEYISNRVHSFNLAAVDAVAPLKISNDATLSGLSLSGVPDEDVGFSSVQTVYNVDVDHDLGLTKVTATPSNQLASVVIKDEDVITSNGFVSLAVGTNVITVDVTAQDGSTMRTYNVFVNRRALSTDATLSSLTLSGTNAPLVDLVEAAKPAGDSGTVLGSVEETTVSAVPSDHRVESVVYKLDGTVIDANSDSTDSIPDGDHVTELAVGANEITVEVTAEDGVTTKTYKVTVTRLRPLSDIATLMSLELENVVLSPIFDMGTGQYTATVAHGVSETVVKYERKDSHATVEIREGNEESNGAIANEQDVAPHNSSIALEVGTNTITVEVTSENGLVSTNYVVTVTREQPSNVATLESLELDPGELSPTFSSTVGPYAATVLHGDDSIDVTYTKSDGTAKVVTKVGGVVGSDNTVTGGDPPLHTSEANTNNTNTVTVPMATVGAYTVTLEVLAQDLTTTGLYVVTVTRPVEPDSNDAALGRLILTNPANNSDVALDPEFELGTADRSFDAEVGNDVMKLEIEAVTNDPDATAQLKKGNTDIGTPSSLAAGQEVDLVEGANVFRIAVIAEDGNATQAYVITVTQLPRPLPGIATLDVLELRDAARAELEFTPAFSTGSAPPGNPYTVSVANGVTRLHVTATPTDPLAGAVAWVGGSVMDGTLTGATQADNDGFVPLAVADGDNTVRVVVTAQNGDTKIYEFTVTRAAAPLNTDATLNSLTLEEATFNFVSTTYSYDVDVGNGVTSATVRAVANSEEASLTATLGSASATSKTDVELTAPLAVGDNDITVVVTPEDATSPTQTYTVTVARAAYIAPPVNVGGGGFGGFGNTGGNTGGGGGGGGGNTGGGGGSPTTNDETVGDPAPDSPYSDVGDAGSDTETAIRELHPLGVFTGTECEQDHICPNDSLTRWVAAVWMVRILDGEEPAAITESRFSDVNASPMWEESMWFAPHVERLAELEITVGCDTDPLRYCPDGNLTRAQVASWIARAFDLPEAESAGFTDTTDSVHEDDIDLVVGAGIASGCDTNPDRFCPDRDVTRGELARFINAARKVASG